MTKVANRQIEFRDFFPRHQASEGLLEFFTPPERVYNELRDASERLPRLVRYDKCPEQHLPLLAATIGFPLLDRPYASVKEQRNLIKHSAYMYAYRGFTESIVRLCEILGFTATFKQVVGEPFYLNNTALYDSADIVDIYWLFDCEDGNLDDWEKILSGSSWEAVNCRIVGQGDGTDSTNNVFINDQTYNCANSSWMVETEFEVLGGSGSKHPNLGICLYWENLGNYLHAAIYSQGGIDYVQVIGCYSGFCLPYSPVQFEVPYDWKTGVHTLRAWDKDHIISIGLDDRTILQGAINPGFWDFGMRKGLFVNQSSRVAFDDFKVTRLNTLKTGHFYSTGEVVADLYMRLQGNPANKTAKKEYLEKVLPQFVPFKVTVHVETV